MEQGTKTVCGRRGVNSVQEMSNDRKVEKVAMYRRAIAAFLSTHLILYKCRVRNRKDEASCKNTHIARYNIYKLYRKSIKMCFCGVIVKSKSSILHTKNHGEKER